jgi:L-ribulose-5-phosphate 4-epimerase
MGYRDVKKELINIVHLACQANLIRLSAGNISTRIEEGLVAITPSGIQYRVMQPDDISIIDLDGTLVEGPPPSSETPMHTAIYRQIPRAGSICHTHSIYGMVFAHLQKDVPLASVELMVCGAPIPVAPWAAPGTEKAGEVTVDLFHARPQLSVILLRQHGLVALGESLTSAYEMAYNAEVGLGTYYQASLLGEPQPFRKDQISEIKEVYGL